MYVLNCHFSFSFNFIQNSIFFEVQNTQRQKCDRGLYYGPAFQALLARLGKLMELTKQLIAIIIVSFVIAKINKT